ncbi:hypothetical protein AVEN_147900-1 [Araneus ventricosus]|uniref:Uncharacterized protein n=1 Tax=Araneus ventricosus TaxID=182803 RepID=A0A4Y2DYJ8_ARAVE|nr:hypothetical protein AVEN_147900-1 [Araneus ventricosus]
MASTRQRLMGCGNEGPPESKYSIKLTSSRSCLFMKNSQMFPNAGTFAVGESKRIKTHKSVRGVGSDDSGEGSLMVATMRRHV